MTDTERTPTEIVAAMRERAAKLRETAVAGGSIAIAMPDHVLNAELQAAVFESAAMLGELFVALMRAPMITSEMPQGPDSPKPGSMTYREIR